MKAKKNNRILAAVLSLVGFSCTFPMAHAVNLYWDVDEATAGAGGSSPASTLWQTGGNTWSTSPNGTVATSATTTTVNDDLFFSAGINATGSYTVFLDDSQSAKSLNVQDGTVTISGAGGGVINFGSGVGAISIGNNISATAALSAIVGDSTNTILAGTGGLVKTGVGTLTLNGSSAHSVTGGLNLAGGTTVLNFANLTTPSDLINGGNALTLSGGALQVTGKTAETTNQSFSGLTVSSGGGQILATNNSATNPVNLSLGAMTTSASGGSLIVGTNNTAGTAGLSITTGTDKDATGIYGGRVVYSSGTANTGFEWATTATASPGPYELSAYSAYSALNTAAGSDSVNSRITAAATMTGSRTTNSLKIQNPTGATTFAIGAGNVLTLTSGGLLITGSNNDMNVTGGSITAGNGASPADLVLHQFNPAQQLAIGVTGANLNNTPEISANIVNNGSQPVTLVKNGSGSIRFMGTNTFTGGIIVNQGNVDFGTNALNNNPMTFNANSVFYTNGTHVTSGSLTLNNGSQVTICNNNSSFTVNANVTGSGGISAANGGQGAMTLNLNGTANTFSGPLRFTHNNGTQSCAINVASLVDTEALGTGNITFGAGTASSISHNFGIAGAAAPITLTNRRFELASDQVNQQINNNSAQNFTINPDLLITGTRGKNLVLGGTGTGISTLAGAIGNHPTPTTAGTIPIGVRTTAVVAANSAITLASVEGIVTGSSITGTGIAANTTIQTVNPFTRQITLNNATTGGIALGTNFTIANVVNSVSVTKSGASTWVLSGNNTYTGPTLISAGVLTVGHANALGATTTGTSVSNGAQLALEGSIITAAEPLTLTPGTSTTPLLRNNSGNNTWNGVITANSATSSHAVRVEANAGSSLTLANTVNVTGSAHQFVLQGDGVVNVTGQVTGVGALTSGQTGAGQRILSNPLNDYSGNTSVNGGTLQMGANNVIPSGTGKGSVILNGGAIAGILDLNGFDVAINGLTGATGDLPGRILNNATGTNKTLTLGNNNATASFSGIIADNSAGTGTVALTKTGTGVQTLAGANTYTGATTVNQGSLNVTGSTAAGSAVSVASGATLTGTGAVAGAVTVASGGALTAGNGASGSLGVGSLTFSGSATVNIGALSNYATTAAINNSGTLTVNGAPGAVTVNLSTTPVASGTYRLISLTSGITDASGFTLGTVPALVGRQTGGSLVYSGVTNSLNYVMAGPTVVWSGAQSSEWSTNVISPLKNWNLSSGGTTDFFTDDDVVFDDTATNKTVDISNGNVSPLSVLFNNSTGNNYTLQGVNGIAGNATLVKSNTGTATITTVNAFTGNLTINAGSLVMGGAGQLGAGSYAGQISNNGSLSYSSTAAQTLSGVISGTGTIAQNGSGILTLSGANTYTGATTINAGILKIGNASALGAGTGVADGTTIVSGATLDLGGTSGANNTERISVSGTGVGGLGAITSSTPIASPFIGVRHLTLTGDTTLDFTNRWDVGDNVAGSTDFLVGGGYNLTVLGTNATAHTSLNFLGETDLGDVNVDLGNAAANILYLQGDTTLGRAANTVKLLNASTLELFTNSTLTSIDKKWQLNDGTIRVSKTGNLDLLGTIDLTGACTINANAATAAVTASNVISGTGDLIKLGTGSLILTGTNTYVGVTSIAGGILSVGSIADSGIACPIGSGNTISLGQNSTSAGRLQFTGAAGGSSNRALLLNNGTNGAGAIENTVAGQTLTLSGDVTAFSTFSACSLTLLGAGDGILSGAIKDGANVSLVKAGTGTWTLTGLNTHYGSNTVNEGTLVINNDYDVLADGTTSRLIVGSGSGTNGAVIIGNSANVVKFGGDGYTNAAQIGINGGTGSLTINTNGTVSLLGASGTSATSLHIGVTISTGAGTGSVTVSNGTLNVGQRILMGANNVACSGTLTITNGTVDVGTNGTYGYTGNNPGVVGFGSGTATLNLDGGKLKVYAFKSQGSGTSTIHFNGGILEAQGSPTFFMGNNGASDAQPTAAGVYNTVVKSGGAIINTNGFDITIPRPMATDPLSTGGGLIKNGAGTLTLTGANTYTGATAVTAGTLALVGGSQASPVTVSTGASLGFTLGSPTTSTSTFNLSAGTIKITGTPTLNSHTLITASTGITGTPVLDAAITGYELKVEGNSLKLVKLGYASWSAVNGAGANLNDDHDTDGVPNGVEYFLGGPNGNTTGFTALPGVTNTGGTLSVTWVMGSGYAGVYGSNFTVETSDTLTGTWTTESLGVTVTVTGSNVKYTFPTPLGSKRFARLKVTGP